MHHENPNQCYDPNNYEPAIPSSVPLQRTPIITPYYSASQMYPSTPRTRPPVPWSTGLCHCFDDPANCVITCVCPCITFGQIADIVDGGTRSCAASGVAYGLLLSFTGLACLYSCIYRSNLRFQYDLEETLSDFFVHFCCETCALCQEYRELRSRGFDMSIGWNANMDRQRRGIVQSPAMTAPVIMGGMVK